MSDQIQLVKSRVDIVDVIGEYVNLKKAGRNFRGLCPFHTEKTPSFMVSPELQTYKCFGCGESGDVYNFLEKHEGLEFFEALQLMAKRAGVELELKKDPQSKQKEDIKKANQEAARFYHYILTKHSNGKDALKYLQKERKLSLETIETFKIGYAPDESKVLTSYLNKKTNFDEKLIESAGLAYRGKYGLVDRFRGRVTFPINDHRGNTIALAGRILPSLSGKGLAKYINSPETPIYHKSSSVYGLDQSKHFVKKANNAVITEGELDMLSSWQNGVKNVVAIKGTALTEDQVYLLSRFTDRLTLALDADFAGDNAALRGITLAQNQNLEVKVISMGKYKDPDEFAQSDSEGYKKAILEAKDVWEFLLDIAGERFDLSTGVGKSRAAKFYLPFLEKLQDSVLRNHYFSEFSRKIDTDPQVLARQFKNNNLERVESEKREENQQKTRREMLEETIARISLMQYPDTLPAIYKELPFKNKQLARIIKLASEEENLDIKKFATKIPEDLKTSLEEILLYDFEDEEEKEDLSHAIHELELMNVKEDLKEIVANMRRYESKNNIKMLQSAQKKFNKLTRKIKKLEEKRNSSII